MSILRELNLHIVISIFAMGHSKEQATFYSKSASYNFSDIISCVVPILEQNL